MITSILYFEPQLQEIKSLLLTENEQPRTTYFVHKNEDYPFTPDELNDWYVINLASFPLSTQPAGDTVSIANRFGNYYRKYHKMDRITETQTVLRKELEGMERDSILLDLEEYIGEWVHNIYVDFAQAIKNVKKQPAFACVQDDFVVMKNLNNYYVNIRQSKEEQLYFFDNTFIPKKVADQMTDILIAILTDRIRMIEANYSIDAGQVKSTTATRLYKINWLATQQEFGELINELTSKGYISFPETPLSIQALNLTRMFDFSASQRKAEANISNNILKMLQPVFDNDEREPTFQYLKPGYIPKFSNVIPHIPQKIKKSAKNT